MNDHTIAFIGLGNMGGPMAANLAKGGLSVRGFDLDPASRDRLAEHGAYIAESARAAVAGADVVISMLPDVPGKLKSGGLFLTSGIIVERQEDVVAAAQQAGLRLRNVTTSGGWVALVFEAEHHA